MAVAFLVTELVELAMSCDPRAQIRIAIRDAEEPGRAVLRVVSRALVENDALRALAGTRYGRGWQLRAARHYDPRAGAYEIGFAVIGRA